MKSMREKCETNNNSNNDNRNDLFIRNRHQ